MYNIYCDESCHLENDASDVMVLGAVYCPIEKVKSITLDINNIQNKYNLSKFNELKWTKVSNSKIDMYKEIVDYFFENDDLHFRALIVNNKSKLDHERFKQTHDEWYYKMYFDMLKGILIPSQQYNIYLDIKDTQGAYKVKQLQEVLANNMYDFNLKVVRKIQNVRSHECKLVQLADLLIGAICYKNRDIKTSEAKLDMVEFIKCKSGYSLDKTTLYREEKFNIFVWEGR